MKPHLKVTLVAVLLGALVLGYNLFRYRDYLSVTATVAEVETTSRSAQVGETGTTKYRDTPTISFRASTGESVVYTPLLHTGEWRRGELVQLVYHPSNPGGSVVRDTFYTKFPLPSLLFSFALLAFVFGGIKARQDARREQARAKWKARVESE